MAKKTNKSRRKRQAVYATKINLEESGIKVPDHIKKIKNPRKHFRMEEYNAKIGVLMSNLNTLQHSIDLAKQSENALSPVAYNSLMIFNLRNAVIQYFVILDEMVNSVLTQRQLENDVPLDEIRYYSKIDEGINEFLPQDQRSADFDKKYSRVKHFRTLRNQFAHYSDGAFMLEASQESFESFLNGLEGIELTTKGGFHGYIDGKPGMSLPYQSTSDEFVHTLFKDGTQFLKVLMETFFPDEGNTANSH